MYGNRTATGRARRNLTRQRSRAEATKKARKQEMTERILLEAKSLLDSGVSKEAVKEFLSSKSKS
jgi:F0F1-type ATP synthase membrane subunit b/b'